MTASHRYRRQVQTRVEEFLAKPREQQSTRETALEAVFELIKLYISFKEEKAKESKHRSRKNNMNDDPKKPRRRHRVRYKELDDEDHNKSPRKHRRRHHRDRSSSRSRSRNPHTSDRKSRYPHLEKSERYNLAKELLDNLNNDQQSKIPDPVIEEEGSISHEPKYMMTGGAGPSRSSLSSDHHDVLNRPRYLPRHLPKTQSPLSPPPPPPSLKPEQKSSRQHDRSVHRSARPPPRPRSALPRHTSPSTGGQAGAVPHSSTHREERSRVNPPSTKSKLGSEKSSTSGFLNHCVNLYREIKAEHEAGYRSKGVLERKLDDVRKKKREGGGGEK